MFRKKFIVSVAEGENFNELTDDDFKDIGKIKARTIDGAYNKAVKLARKAIADDKAAFVRLSQLERGV